MGASMDENGSHLQSHFGMQYVARIATEKI
jgi:hypothetical protein